MENMEPTLDIYMKTAKAAWPDRGTRTIKTSLDIISSLFCFDNFNAIREISTKLNSWFSSSTWSHKIICFQYSTYLNVLFTDTVQHLRLPLNWVYNPARSRTFLHWIHLRWHHNNVQYYFEFLMYKYFSNAIIFFVA